MISSLLLLVPHLLFIISSCILLVIAKHRRGGISNEDEKYGCLRSHVTRWIFSFLRIAIYVASILECFLAMFTSKPALDLQGYSWYLTANLIAIAAILLAQFDYYCIEKQFLHKRHLGFFVVFWCLECGCSIARLWIVLDFVSSVHIIQVCMLLGLGVIHLLLDVITLGTKVSQLIQRLA